MRKRPVMVVLIVLLVIACASLTILETSNSSKFDYVQRKANVLIAQGVSLEQAAKFHDAAMAYRDAAKLFVPLKQLLSPILKLNDAADRQHADLSKHAETIDVVPPPSQTTGAHVAKTDLENIREFETGLMRLRKPDQVAEFGSIEAELEFKRAFEVKFHSLLQTGDVRVPLLVLPNTDNVNVFMDDMLLGTASARATPELNTFRYPLGLHRFKFTTLGYTTVEISTSELKSPRYTLILEKIPIQP